MSNTLEKLWPSMNGHTITNGAAHPNAAATPNSSALSNGGAQSNSPTQPGGDTHPNGSAQPDGAMTPEKAASKSSRTIYVVEPNVWIINDGLLRDEGVLFGLEGASYDEKVEAISNYYDEQKAPNVLAQQLFEEKIKAGQQELAAARVKVVEKQQEIDAKETPARRVSDSNYIRDLAGLILAVVGSVGCFYIVHHFVSPGYGIPATCGIFLFGLFTQMVPISSWMQESSSAVAAPVTRGLALVKQYLLEFGPPVVSAILVAYLIYIGSASIGQSLIFGLFLLFLFFYNGKLILGLSQVLIREVKKYKEFRHARRDHEKSLSELQTQLTALQAQEADKLREIGGNEDCRKAELTKIEEMNEAKRNKVNLFISEYKLARHFITNIKPKDSE